MKNGLLIIGATEEQAGRASTPAQYVNEDDEDLMQQYDTFVETVFVGETSESESELDSDSDCEKENKQKEDCSSKDSLTRGLHAHLHEQNVCVSQECAVLCAVCNEGITCTLSQCTISVSSEGTKRYTCPTCANATFSDIDADSSGEERGLDEEHSLEEQQSLDEAEVSKESNTDTDNTPSDTTNEAKGHAEAPLDTTSEAHRPVGVESTFTVGDFVYTNARGGDKRKGTYVVDAYVGRILRMKGGQGEEEAELEYWVEVVDEDNPDEVLPDTYMRSHVQDKKKWVEPVAALFKVTLLLVWRERGQ